MKELDPKKFRKRGTTQFKGKTKMEIANAETLKMIRARREEGFLGVLKRLFKGQERL